MTRAERIIRDTVTCCPTCKRPLQKLPLEVDLDTNTIIANGTALRVSARHAELVSVLAKCAPRTVRSDTLITAVWGIEADVGTKLLHTTVCLARRQVEALGYAIRNHPGTGYSLVKK